MSIAVVVVGGGDHILHCSVFTATSQTNLAFN